MIDTLELRLLCLRISNLRSATQDARFKANELDMLDVERLLLGVERNIEFAWQATEKRINEEQAKGLTR